MRDYGIQPDLSGWESVQFGPSQGLTAQAVGFPAAAR